MRKDRLLKLADFLETVPRKAFDIKDWQTKGPTKPEGKVQGECGFAGCAMGWAAHARLFRGFHFYETANGKVGLHYGDDYNWGAVDAVFDLGPRRWLLGSDQATHLFSSDSYERNPTPKQVAKRIRQFVKDGGLPNV